MDSEEAAKKLKSGEYDLLMFPLVPRFNFNVNPMDPWKKAKKIKGAEHILAVWQGYTDDDEIYIDKIAVRKPYRRASIASKMLDYFRLKHPDAKITITGVTDDGRNFVSKYANIPKEQLHKDGEIETKNEKEYRINNNFNKDMGLENPKF